MHKDELFFMPVWGSPSDSLRDWTPLEGPKEYDNSFSEGQPLATIKLSVYLTHRTPSSFIGSFFGGSPSVIHWWHETYWA